MSVVVDLSTQMTAGRFVEELSGVAGTAVPFTSRFRPRFRQDPEGPQWHCFIIRSYCDVIKARARPSVVKLSPGGSPSEGLWWGDRLWSLTDKYRPWCIGPSLHVRRCRQLSVWFSGMRIEETHTMQYNKAGYPFSQVIGQVPRSEAESSASNWS